jgi:hypothetical protein
MSCYGCDAVPRIYNPFGNTNLQGVRGLPNVVRAPRTPLYQLGWLGDDTTDSSLPDFTGLGPTVDSPILGPVDYSATFPASPDQSSPDTPVNPNSGVVFGPPGPGQPGGLPASAGSSIASAISNLFRPTPTTTLAPGPAPRVGVPYAAASPTLALGTALPILAIGVVGMVLLTSGGGGRRRRR